MKANRPTPQTPNRDKLVLENLALVKAIAHRIRETLPVHIDNDDLVQAGTIGLIDAASKFDEAKQVSFALYAKHRIRGAILDALRQQDWASRDMRRRQKEVEAATQEAAMELQRTPTEEEVANTLGIPVDELQHVKALFAELHTVSTSGNQANDEMAVPELPATPEMQPDAMYSQAELKRVLGTAVKTLSPRYQQVITSYYGHQMTMKEIGRSMQINESRVSQIHKTALEKLAVALEASGVQASAAFA